MRFAIVDGGRVSNVAEADETFGLAQGWVPAGNSVERGDLYDGAIFSKLAVAPEVPAAVTYRQGMAVLIKYGHDAQIDAALYAQLAQAQASGDAQAVLATKLAINDWKNSTAFERDWPLIEQMRVAFGWTTQYVDQLFIEASTL